MARPPMSDNRRAACREAAFWACLWAVVGMAMAFPLGMAAAEGGPWWLVAGVMALMAGVVLWAIATTIRDMIP